MCVFYLARWRTGRLCQGAPNARAALVSAGVASAAAASATGGVSGLATGAPQRRRRLLPQPRPAEVG